MSSMISTISAAALGLLGQLDSGDLGGEVEGEGSVLSFFHVPGLGNPIATTHGT